MTTIFAVRADLKSACTCTNADLTSAASCTCTRADLTSAASCTCTRADLKSAVSCTCTRADCVTFRKFFFTAVTIKCMKVSYFVAVCCRGLCLLLSAYILHPSLLSLPVSFQHLSITAYVSRRPLDRQSRTTEANTVASSSKTQKFVTRLLSLSMQ